MTNSDAGDEVSGTHPRYTAGFFGHADAENALLKSYQSGRIPHAWLIGGPHGVGKATLAYRMARFVLSHPDASAETVQVASSLAVEPDHIAARRIAARGHPDLLVLERAVGDSGKLRTVITVDQVRQIVPFFGSTAGEGGWRIGIVDPVDDLNEAGENALLKLLEEPPARALFLLVTHAPGRVRSTIRSRCRRLLLRSLAEENVAKAAAAATGRTDDEPQVLMAARAAEGSVARAIGLMDEDALQFRQRILDLLDRLPDVDLRALHALGDALAAADQTAFDTYLDTINGWLSARLHRTTEDRPRLAAISGAWERINRSAGEALGYNLDRRPLIFETFAALAQAARR